MVLSSLFFSFYIYGIVLNGCLYFHYGIAFSESCLLLPIFSSMILPQSITISFLFSLTTLALSVSAYKVESLTLIFHGLN